MLNPENSISRDRDLEFIAPGIFRNLTGQRWISYSIFCRSGRFCLKEQVVCHFENVQETSSLFLSAIDLLVMYTLVSRTALFRSVAKFYSDVKCRQKRVSLVFAIFWLIQQLEVRNFSEQNILGTA